MMNYRFEGRNNSCRQVSMLFLISHSNRRKAGYPTIRVISKRESTLILSFPPVPPPRKTAGLVPLREIMTVSLFSLAYT